MNGLQNWNSKPNKSVAMKNLMILIGLIGMPLILAGQKWHEFVTGGDNYYDIVSAAEQHFNRTGKGRGSGYKQYMRWREQMEIMISPSGEIRNFSALNYKETVHLLKYARMNRSTHGTWEDLGPTDYYVSDAHSGGGVGRINCMAFHPTDPNTFWIGAPIGGLWKTTDDGATWTPMTDHFPSIGISGIVVDPTDPEVIYILTGDGDGLNYPSIGVMKTTDGGQTWNPGGLQFGPDQFVFGTKLLGHPTDPDILFATFRVFGIFRTDDGGVSWTQVVSGRSVWDIEFKPGDPSVVYAAASDSNTGTLLKSTDTGQFFALEDDPDFPDTASRMAIAVSPSAPDNVYALFGGNNAIAGTFRGMFKSTDQGDEFTMQANSPNILASDMSGNNLADQSGYDICIEIDPGNDSRVFVGGINMWKSEDDGITWQRETWWMRNDPLNPYVHADWHNIYYQGGYLYANVDGGIYRSGDNGHSWSELTSGLSLMQFYEIDILNSEYIGGTQDNGTNGSNFGDPQAHSILGGDGFGCTWHTGDNSIQYISTQNAVYRRQFGTSIPISPIEMGFNDFWFTEIEMHTTDPDFVFVSTFNEIYRGNGDAFGFSWDSLRLSSTHTDTFAIVTNFVQGTSDPDVMYACIDTAFLKCEDISAGTPAWTTLSGPFTGVELPRDVEIDPSNSDKVWVCLGGFTDSLKVFYSSDGGSTWTNISGGLPNVPALCLAYEPGSNDGIYVGTSIGMFYRNAAMSDWMYFSNYFPNTQIQDIEISAGYVFAGTFGRGIWRSPTYSSCPFDLVLTPGNDLGNPLSMGLQIYHAENSIQTTRIIQGSTAEVFYYGGNYIDMLDGFWSRGGGFMEAQPDGCPD